MSPTPSIPEEDEQFTAPPTPQDDSDEAQCYPPMHPVPSMQAAFEESMFEQGHPPPEPVNPYAVATTVQRKALASAGFKPKYHPLTKLVSQITFGIHLLHRRLAKSDSEVVRILQAHVNDMDNFLSTTTRDFDSARADISTRIKNLKVPLEAGPASDVFENMLRDPAFRMQIIEGNKKVDFVIKRTAKAMNVALEDVGEGLRAVDELAKYLLTLKTGWRNANLMRVYGAMTHNVEGWFRCFVGLQMKGQVLGERLNSLKMVVWEIERRCGRASRGGGRSSMAVVKKRPSLNQIPENPSGEAAHDTATMPPIPTNSNYHQNTAVPQSVKEVDEKPLPTTPIPTPVPVVGAKDAKHKRHSSGDIISSPPMTPHRTLSKRRTSVPGPPASTAVSSSPIKAQQASERTVETIVVLDHESGTLRRKRIHRRSATIHAGELSISRTSQDAAVKRPTTAGMGTVTTTVTAGNTDQQQAQAQAATGSGTGVLSSLRRSLSLGRSASGRSRSRSREGKSTDGDDRGRPPPVPRLPANMQEQIERMKREEAAVIMKAVPTAELTPPASRDSKAGASEKSVSATGGHHHGGVTGAVKAGIASIKKRKSKAHLHTPSSGKIDHEQIVAVSAADLKSMPPIPGQMKRTHTSPVVSSSGGASSMPSKIPTPSKNKNKSKSPAVNNLKLNTESAASQSAAVELPTAAAGSSTTPSSSSQTPTTPRTKPRRNSSAISNLLSLRPKSRHGVSAPTEPLPPMPVSIMAKPVHVQNEPQQTITVKQSNVGNSAILAGVHELQNSKKAQATPAFKLQGASETTARPIEPRSTLRDSARRVSVIGSTHSSIKTSGDSKKSIQEPVVGSPAGQQGRGKNSFLVKFFTDRAF